MMTALPGHCHYRSLLYKLLSRMLSCFMPAQAEVLSRHSANSSRATTSQALVPVQQPEEEGQGNDNGSGSEEATTARISLKRGCKCEMCGATPKELLHASSLQCSCVALPSFPKHICTCRRKGHEVHYG